jgi:hypothetical protein
MCKIIQTDDRVICVQSFNGMSAAGCKISTITLPQKNEIFTVDIVSDCGKWLYLRDVNDINHLGLRVRYDVRQFRKVNSEEDFGSVIADQIEKTFVASNKFPNLKFHLN